jgi:hypothetical protein
MQGGDHCRWFGRKSGKVEEESAERGVMGNGKAVMVEGGKENEKEDGRMDGWGVVKHAAWALQEKRGWIQGGDERTCRTVDE